MRNLTKISCYFVYDLTKNINIMSTTTSKKHKIFVCEPMGNKPVTDLAGVGEVLGKRLVDAGFTKAYGILGKFLILEKNQELFQKWMKDICAANSKQSAECHQCLSEWSDEFL